ncbi:MAG: cytochrome P450 [Chloroflexota bacterium]
MAVAARPPEPKSAQRPARIDVPTPTGPSAGAAGPPGRGPGGSLRAFRRDPLSFLTSCARDYGDFVPLRIALRRAVLLSHPDLVEEVLVTQHQNFVKTPLLRRSRRLLGHGLLLSEGDFWRRQRRLMQPAFHRQRIAGYGETMVRATERTLATWRDGEACDIHQDMMALTLEIVCRTLFGADISGEAAEVAAAMATAQERINARMGSWLALLPDTFPTPGNLAFLRAAKRLDAIIDGIIEQRRAGAEDTGDLLSMLLDARDDDGRGMTDQQLRDEVMTLFLAGHETTALALSWTWYLLAQHPAVEARLHDELRAVLCGQAPAAGDVPQLRYTEAVISEALRLYPPAWTQGREAVRDCVIGGYPVRAGTVVVLSQWVLHRDPRFFDQPEAFMPERWTDPSAGSEPALSAGSEPALSAGKGQALTRRLPRFAYFPFGGGPRLCIGSSFAMMEAVLLLAAIAQQFRLALVPGQTIVPWPAITLRPKGGIHVTLHRR